MSIETIKREVSEIILQKREMQKINSEYAKLHPRLKFAIERHLNSRGVKMDFNKHAYLIPLYCDDSKEIVAKKPRKVGLSEWLNVRVFEAAEKKISTLYILPNQTLRGIYVAERIDPLIEMCYLDMMHRDREGSRIMKKFKSRANALFAGSNTQSELIMITADQLIEDEYDFCNHKNLKVADEVLGYSAYGYKIKISTPTIEGMGIDGALKESDNKHWFNKCPHCNERQILNFFGNVLEKDEYVKDDWRLISEDTSVHCIKCRKTMDRHAVGEYVAQREHEISGYNITALCHPKNTMETLYKSYKDSKDNEWTKQIFYNHSLGECYTPEGANITQNLLDNCKGNYNLSSTNIDIHDRCVMGIDVGKFFHLVIGRVKRGRLQIVAIRKLLIKDDASITEIFSLIKVHRVKRGVIDVRPETKLSNKISEKSGGIIWTCDYSTQEGATEMFIEHKDDKHVVANRTWSIDSMVEGIKLQTTELPREAHSIDNGDFYAQMQAPTRLAILNPKGIMRYSWEEGNKDDHYFHATNYCNIAAKQISSMTDIGDNPKGFQPEASDRQMTSMMDDDLY